MIIPLFSSLCKFDGKYSFLLRLMVLKKFKFKTNSRISRQFNGY
jgi:hypothetical protein